MTGVVLMSVGIWAHEELNDLIKLSTVYEPGPAYVLIVTGALIILGGALACYATVKGQHSLLYIVRTHLFITSNLGENHKLTFLNIIIAAFI